MFIIRNTFFTVSIDILLALHRCLRGEPTDAQTVNKYIETYVNNVYNNNLFRYALTAGREYVKKYDTRVGYETSNMCINKD